MMDMRRTFLPFRFLLLFYTLFLPFFYLVFLYLFFYLSVIFESETLFHYQESDIQGRQSLFFSHPFGLHV